MTEMTKNLMSRIKISMYWQQICLNLSEEGTHIVFAYDNNDNLIGQSNSIYPELRYFFMI